MEKTSTAVKKSSSTSLLATKLSTFHNVENGCSLSCGSSSLSRASSVHSTDTVGTSQGSSTASIGKHNVDVGHHSSNNWTRKRRRGSAVASSRIDCKKETLLLHSVSSGASSSEMPLNKTPMQPLTLDTSSDLICRVGQELSPLCRRRICDLYLNYMNGMSEEENGANVLLDTALSPTADVAVSETAFTNSSSLDSSSRRQQMSREKLIEEVHSILKDNLGQMELHRTVTEYCTKTTANALLNPVSYTKLPTDNNTNSFTRKLFEECADDSLAGQTLSSLLSGPPSAQASPDILPDANNPHDAHRGAPPQGRLYDLLMEKTDDKVFSFENDVKIASSRKRSIGELVPSHKASTVHSKKNGTISSQLSASVVNATSTVSSSYQFSSSASSSSSPSVILSSRAAASAIAATLPKPAPPSQSPLNVLRTENEHVNMPLSDKYPNLDWRAVQTPMVTSNTSRKRSCPSVEKQIASISSGKSGSTTNTTIPAAKKATLCTSSSSPRTSVEQQPSGQKPQNKNASTSSCISTTTDDSESLLVKLLTQPIATLSTVPRRDSKSSRSVLSTATVKEEEIQQIKEEITEKEFLFAPTNSVDAFEQYLQEEAERYARSQMLLNESGESAAICLDEKLPLPNEKTLCPSLTSQREQLERERLLQRQKSQTFQPYCRQASESLSTGGGQTLQQIPPLPAPAAMAVTTSSLATLTARKMSESCASTLNESNLQELLENLSSPPVSPTTPMKLSCETVRPPLLLPVTGTASQKSLTESLREPAPNICVVTKKLNLHPGGSGTTSNNNSESHVSANHPLGSLDDLNLESLLASLENKDVPVAPPPPPPMSRTMPQQQQQPPHYPHQHHPQTTPQFSYPNTTAISFSWPVMDNTGSTQTLPPFYEANGLVNYNAMKNATNTNPLVRQELRQLLAQRSVGSGGGGGGGCSVSPNLPPLSLSSPSSQCIASSSTTFVQHPRPAQVSSLHNHTPGPQFYLPSSSPTVSSGYLPSLSILQPSTDLCTGGMHFTAIPSPTPSAHSNSNPAYLYPLSSPRAPPNAHPQISPSMAMSPLESPLGRQNSILHSPVSTGVGLSHHTAHNLYSGLSYPPRSPFPPHSNVGPSQQQHQQQQQQGIVPQSYQQHRHFSHPAHPAAYTEMNPLNTQHSYHAPTPATPFHSPQLLPYPSPNMCPLSVDSRMNGSVKCAEEMTSGSKMPMPRSVRAPPPQMPPHTSKSAVAELEETEALPDHITSFVLEYLGSEKTASNAAVSSGPQSRCSRASSMTEEKVQVSFSNGPPSAAAPPPPPPPVAGARMSNHMERHSSTSSQSRQHQHSHQSQQQQHIRASSTSSSSSSFSRRRPSISNTVSGSGNGSGGVGGKVWNNATANSILEDLLNS